MHQDAFSLWGIFQATLGGSRVATVKVAIHEVIDHFDVILYVKLAQSALSKIVRDCSYSVALLDGETGDGQIGAVETDQRNVGAVQRSDKGQALSAGLGCEHLPGQQCAYRVRDGIVHVQNVESVE